MMRALATLAALALVGCAQGAPLEPLRAELRGIVPQWDDDEQTIYGGSVQRVGVAAVRKRRAR